MGGHKNAPFAFKSETDFVVIRVGVVLVLDNGRGIAIPLGDFQQFQQFFGKTGFLLGKIPGGVKGKFGFDCP